MKKIMSVLLLALLATIDRSAAQSYAHLYDVFMSQSTIAANPMTSASSAADYFTTETTIRPAVTALNQIHAVRYDHFGNIMNIAATPQDFILIDTGANCRNVDLVPIDEDLFLQVSFYKHTQNEPNKVKVRLAVIRFAGATLNIVAENIIESSALDHNSLFALDAIYDKGLEQFVICGMAVNELDVDPQHSKRAFVMTVDRFTLTPNRLMYYDSQGGNRDYDIANRIVLTSNGNYYITGAENGEKFNIYQNMVMRNMLIDPVTLQYTTPGTWSQPLSVNSDDHEIASDMVEIYNQNISSNVFILLARSSNGPVIIDVDPVNGNPINTFSQFLAHNAFYGSSITQVDPSTHEVYIHGMQYAPNTDSCNGSFSFDAAPFLAIVDVGSYPATLITKKAYSSIVGNSVVGSDFWNWGDIYRPMSGYPIYVPIYFNKFATFNGANNDFGVIAPIHSQSTILNTKFIFTDDNGATDCPMVDCGELTLNYKVILPDFYDTAWKETTDEEVSQIVVRPIELLKVYSCEAPDEYYKSANSNSNSGYAIKELSVRNETDIYPNPATNEIKIELASYYSNKVSIALFDITGKKVADVFSGMNDRKTINYSIPEGIANGIYHLSISSKGQKTTTYKVNIIR